MKTRLTHRQAAPHKGGFTLIEVLIVISIMAFLLAAAWSARNLYLNMAMKNTAETQLALLAAGVEAYKADSGGVLPYANGDEWSGHVLYGMLSGDTNNDGKPDRNKKTDQMNTVYIKDLVIIKSNAAETAEGIPVIKRPLQKSPDAKGKRGARFIILDPWGTAYRYRLGCEAETTGSKEGTGVNADFDIYSLGPDTEGNARDNEGQNKDNISNIKSL